MTEDEHVDDVSDCFVLFNPSCPIDGRRFKQVIGVVSVEDEDGVDTNGDDAWREVDGGEVRCDCDRDATDGGGGGGEGGRDECARLLDTGDANESNVITKLDVVAADDFIELCGVSDGLVLGD